MDLVIIMENIRMAIWQCLQTDRFGILAYKVGNMRRYTDFISCGGAAHNHEFIYKLISSKNLK
jgi:hypothetical protein